MSLKAIVFKKGVVLLGWLGTTVLFGHAVYPELQNDPKKLATQYCGRCHLVPAPSDLPRYLWAKTILPEMGRYYGINTKGVGRMKEIKSGKAAEINDLNLYPEQQVISDADWQMIRDYYLDNAPQDIKVNPKRKRRNGKLRAFEPKDINLLDLPGSLITAFAYDNSNHRLWIGEDRLMAYSWRFNRGVSNKTSTSSTVSHIAFSGDTTYLVEIGSLVPTTVKNGSVSVRFGEKEPKTIIRNLHRPVHALVDDINGNGETEIIISNFGHQTGSLSLFSAADSLQNEKVIHRQAGAIKCFAQDMDEDGKKDLIAMFAQGDESIFIFYQRAGFQFVKERILRFNPLYGSNDFVMVDYENDGDLDIVVAQGDNADISVTSKPYHGIRLFINEDNQFREQFFYPLYGATKVLADDFDQDGDVDLVATAFYQDYQTLPNEGLIYLENVNADAFQFRSFELKRRDPIRSYTLEKGDVDQDGDIDIIVGLFSSTITQVPQPLSEIWHRSDYDMTILFNISN